MPPSITIIGGGVIGLCSAWYCRQRGLEVTVIDLASEQHEGCSYGNAGMVCPSHFVPLAAPGMVALGLKWMWNPASPFYIQPRFSWELLDWGWKFWRAATRQHVERAGPLLRDLGLGSRRLYTELAEQFGNEFGLQQNGLLMLCKTTQVWDEEAHLAEAAQKLGIPAEVLDAKQTAALDQAVTLDVQGSVYFSQDCHLAPQRLMAGLKQRLREQGVTFLWETDVSGCRVEGRRIVGVQTSAGEMSADQVLLAGGSWSPALAKSLGLAIPMQAGKGYSLTVPQPRQLPRICSILTEARVAVTPMGQSLRFGGTMEIAGLNERISPRRVQGIIDSVPRYFPEFRAADFAGIQPWVGLRPCSPDGLPYLGRTKRYDNLLLATGHAMLGLSLGPITGKLISQLATKELPEIDLQLLSPDRYSR